MNRKLIIAACITILFTNVSFAEVSKYAGIQLTSSDFKKAILPSSKNLNFIIAEQGYEDGQPLVFSSDINGDGVLDYIIESDYRVCGTGGCVYVLVDGKTLEKKGEFFGSPPIISDSKVSEHSRFMMLTYSEPDKATLDIYEYNKKEYVLTKSIKLQGNKLVNQLNRFKSANHRVVR